MARARNDSTPTCKEDIREKKLAELRERARQVAEIVVRLPADRSQVRDSEARRELLSTFGLTVAVEAESMDAIDLVAQTTDFGGMSMFGGKGHWIRDEFYSPSADEIRQIAAEELDRAGAG